MDAPEFKPEPPLPISKVSEEQAFWALDGLLRLESWEARRILLERLESILLSQTCEKYLARVLSPMQQTTEPPDYASLAVGEAIATLIRRARELDLSQAWPEVEASGRIGTLDPSEDSYDSPRRVLHNLTPSLLDWLRISDHCELRRYLEQHRELLHPLSAIPLIEQIVQAANDPERVRELRDRLYLLHEARTLGGTVEAICIAAINALGGFALELPPWLEAIEHEVTELAHAKRRDQTASARATLLRAALARASLDATLRPEILAELESALWDALDDTFSIDQRQIKEEGIECLTAALQIYCYEQYPRQYARTQANLAMAYLQRIEGSRKDNIEQAIACCHEALRIHTLADFPVQYANIQLVLNYAYDFRIAGSQQENIELSISSCHQALQVYSLAAYPDQYAAVQNNLGLAYTYRMVGNKRDNFEQALSCFKEALRVRTLEQYPIQYANVQNNLGLAYLYRVAGDRQQNLEQAVSCLHEALRVRTPADFPIEYAETQSLLGKAYTLLDREQDAFYEQGISCLREALDIYSRAHIPERCAVIQLDLATVYLRQISPETPEKLVQAENWLNEALRVYTENDYPSNFRNVQQALGWLHYRYRAQGAEVQQDLSALRSAYEQAHHHFVQARRVQSELGWLESQEQGRAVLRGHEFHLKELYIRDAWCLWQLGDVSGAIVALEAGRAQALAEAQAIRESNIALVCPEHAESFLLARQTLEEARRAGEFSALRAARDAFLAVRQAIRNHCYQDFLPSEPTFENILQAPVSNQVLVYLAAADRGGMALILPPAQGPNPADAPIPIAIPLPKLTWQVVDDWLKRPDPEGYVVGGWQSALNQEGIRLLHNWLGRGDDETVRARHIALPLQHVLATLPESRRTLRQAFERVLMNWRAVANQYANGTARQQALAKLLRSQLAVPLGIALEEGILARELDWFFHEAELEALLPELGDAILRPLRQGLNNLGLDAPNRSIALIPCGRLGILPLHAALVPDPHTGEEVPFQETCELTYQASARILSASHVIASELPQAGALVTIGNPQPTTHPPLPWAEAEAEAITHLAELAGRTGSVALLGEEATLSHVTAVFDGFRQKHSGIWIEVASHGHTDPADPRDCFMLLAHDERLTLADLQQERLLEGVRCFVASGCVTGLGDMETAPDELSSFAAGVLQAGAACAVATLWSVSDRATFLLMLRFHQLLLGDARMTPAGALREAAKWLRQATRKELNELARAGLAGMRPIPPKKADLARDAIRGVSEHDDMASLLVEDLPEPLRFSAAKALSKFRLMDAAKHMSERPYAHPIYWASAVVYGA